MAELSLFLTQNKPFIYTFGVMPSCQSWDYILLSVSTYVCYVNTCKNSHISITLINNTGHVIPYHLILHDILCLFNLLNLLITPLCLTFRYAILPYPHILIYHCCAAQENLPYRPSATQSKIDQGPQLLCSEIHCHIGSEVKFPGSCFWQ